MGTANRLILLTALAFGASSIASATTFTGVFTASTDFGTPGLGNASTTWSNFGGATGLTLIATCGASVSGCTLENGNNETSGYSLGVYETGSTDGSIQEDHGEYIIFNFGQTVTLSGVQLNIIADSGYEVELCGSGSSNTSCVSPTVITEGTVSTTGTDNLTFTATQGQYFEILAPTSGGDSLSSTKFGINELDGSVGASTPEPATLSLVGLSLLGLGGLRARRRRAK